jgi:hypothetical protein
MNLLAALLLSPKAHAWGHHYLVTDQALRHAEVAAQVEEAVSVEELQSFLVAEAAGVAGVFSAYRDWQVEREQVRYAYIPFEPGQPSVSGFLRAARLNPEARFPLVWRRLPGEPVQLGGGGPSRPSRLPGTSFPRSRCSSRWTRSRRVAPCRAGR